MPIRIKTEVTPGCRGRTVKKIEALLRKDLPNGYLNSKKPHVYKCEKKERHEEKSKGFLIGNDGLIFKESCWYNEDEFQEKLKFVKEAGKNLHRIRRRIEERKRKKKLNEEKKKKKRIEMIVI